MKKLFSKEIIIALSVIVSGILLVMAINFMKGINLMKPANYYYVEYENVNGLTVSTPVLVDGFKVGLVRSMRYDYEKTGHVIVEISLDNKLKVPSGSKALLKVDFLGTATIDLELNKYVSTLHKAGDTLVGENAPDMLGGLQNDMLPQVTALLPKLDSILSGVQALVGDEAVSASVHRLDNITANLEASSAQLNRLMGQDVPALLKNVSSITGNVDQFTGTLNRLELEQTLASLDTTIANLRSVSEELKNPDGTIGQLMNNGALYDKLVHTAGSADSLLIDLRENPKRYVHFSLFGKKQ
ncbi:MAG: MCE family protein [Coprobacter sp.]|nr:MCE family protein [Coprobacter sp.]